MGLSAQRLYDRGVAHGNAGRNAAARRDLRSALTRTDDPDLRARVLGTLAYIEARTGDPAAAEMLCLEGLADPRVGAATRAVLDGQLGVLALMSGQAQQARALLSRALENAEDGPTSGRMRINRSVAAMQLGDLSQARSDLTLAAATFERAGDEVERAKALHNLGYTELLAGDLVQALGHMASARPALESQSAVAAAQCDVDRADVLRDAGLTTEAERILERVARTFGSHGMTQARAESELSLARSLLSHDPPAAARVARQAARRFRAIRSATWALRADAVRTRAELVTDAYGRRGERRAATRPTTDAQAADELAAALSRAGFDVEALTVRLAAALRLTENGSAVTTPRVPATAPTGPRLMLHQLRARRAELRGAGADVRRHCARGLDELILRQASFGSLDLQTSAAMHAVPLMVTGLSSAVATRRPDVVFEWSERARHLSQSVVPLRPPPDPLLAADLAELRRLRGDGADEHWLADPRAAALRDRIRDRQWSGVGARGVQDRADLAALRAGLDDHTALLAYVWAGDRLACVVATSDRAEVVDLAPWAHVRGLIAGLRADLDVSASVTSGPLADVVRRSRDERLAALSAALLAEPAARSGARRFVITAPGVLNGLPWGMLPAMSGHPFTLAVSASRWLSLRGGAAAQHAVAGFVAGPRVVRAGEEVQRAAAAWGTARTLTDAQATVGAVTELAGAVDVLHIAAHGRHAVDNPLFSGLELVDGTLFGYDIDLMPTVPRTVVLSACEVGRSSVRWGEEAIGMTRGWLHAGTRCVVAAPVVVADDVACELLTAMHEALAAGETPSEALALAGAQTGIVAPFQVHGAGF
ncbi:hypothetical protein ASD56_06455 [Microbacterium sp. Root166]|uniref:CHAT domain-containing protein n=1 Tax=Microbacterium sp. Root166 TaxID=1736478 RepID=UPI0006FA49FF|nr:CHAT domain-containing protein [Microbacterium sp. Root166]KQZ85917.1 hypothetical protein ASD56_06455 [Microbacterium sp. Root166]